MKRFLVLCVLTSLSGLCLAAARAEFAIVANTSSLNLRSGPGYEYQVVGSAGRNEWVDIHSGTNGWDYVTVIRTGKSGYMVDSFLKRAQTESGHVGVVSNMTASAFLNLREYPSYSAPVLGIYYNGDLCRVLGHENGWYRVEIEGMTGYFREEFLKVSGGTDARVIAANGKPVNLRSGPAMTYPSNGSLPVGTRVTVLMKGSGFWQVEAGGMNGYMSSVYLSEGTGDGGGTKPAASGYLVVANPGNGKVNLRAQPSLSAKVLAQFENGVRLEVVEGGLTWCQVYSQASGLSGFIMTRYTKVFGLPGTPEKAVANGNSYVNLRGSPNLSKGKVLARVQSGERVTILVPGDEWCQVKYGETVGYMMTHFLK